MRSRLEGQFARYLDSQRVRWKYEPRAYAGPHGDYLPDFELLDEFHPTFVDVKPEYAAVETIERCMERMEIIWESVSDAILMIAFGDSPVALTTVDRRWELTAMPEWAALRDEITGAA